MRHVVPTADCGVIVGRFQVAELHDAHRELVKGVLEKHAKVLVLLGVAPLVNTINNPLDFEARKQMLAAEFPELTILYVRDVNDDEAWSRSVDRIIRDFLSPTQTALLYGGRDSFISHYYGTFDCVELPEFGGSSGSDVRAELGRVAKNSPEWRAGVIWASRNRFPVSFQCVDVAIFNPDYTKLLLGQKAYETAWRLIGGFADPASSSLEQDATREVAEETGTKVKDLRYVRSFQVDDWRYRGEPDCIKTALFTAWTEDEATAADDILHVRWFDLAEVSPRDQFRVMPVHRKLVTHALIATNQFRPKEFTY